MTGDIASELVSGVDRFLLRQIDESTANRAMHWKRDFSPRGAYIASVEPNRKRLGHILGVRDPRVSFDKPERFQTATVVEARSAWQEGSRYATSYGPLSAM